MSEFPLSGKRVAVTRPLPTRGEDTLVSLLRSAGALPLHVPLIRTLPPADSTLLYRAAREVDRYDWIVLTSARAVEPLQEALQSEECSLKCFAALGTRVCAVGPATAEALEAAGIAVDLVPRRFDAEGVVEAMLETDLSAGGRVLLPRAEEGRDVIPMALAAAGIAVDVVTAYRTVPLPEEALRLVNLIREGAIDLLTFTSGSAVRSFAAAWSSDAPPEVGIVSLGPSSTVVLSELGFPVHAEARLHTIRGLMAALDKWAST